MEAPQHELPRYKSHKIVWALKIAAIEAYRIPNGPDAWQIFPADAGYGPIVISDEFKKKHQPQVGGYWVLYKGGYTSFSPADAFEEGNTRDTGEPTPTLLKEATLLELSKAIAKRIRELVLNKIK